MEDELELDEDIEEEPKKGRGRPARSTPELGLDLDEFNKMVDTRLESYMNDLEESSVTIADRQQMRTLAELSVLSELSNQKAAKMVLGRSSPQDIKYVSDSARAFSVEARQLATSLGIDRKSRVTDQESELETYLPQLHKEAKEFIYKHAVAIVCPHCLKEDARIELRMGTILYHFAYELNWSWSSKCPKCKGDININQNNYTKFLFSELDKGGVAKLGKNELEDDLLEDDEE